MLSLGLISVSSFTILCPVNCRRKDLKQAVHRLRNQLQLHQTKKATTISVLKASELEIKVVNDLVVV